MEINVSFINSASIFFEKILELHKKNTQTLGFLPREAFVESIKNNLIVIAVDENSTLVGYLLYSINKRGNFIYIVHLCVEKEMRKNGIGKLMFDFLVEQTKKNYRGIRVTCREDFEATKVWKKLKFVYANEKVGRSRKGTRLFVWWYGFNHPNLFSIKETSNKVKVVLDSNIVYELMEGINSRNENSHALFDDWLTNDIDYCITDELKNDISVNTNASTREECMNFISNFSLVQSNFELFNDIESEIKKLYKTPLSYRDESDIRHLMRTINSESNYFITKDEKLLNKSEIFFEKFGLYIFRPSEFIIHYSFTQNDFDYMPYKFSGTVIQIKIPKIEEIKKISDDFYLSVNENKREYSNKVNQSLVGKKSRPYLIKTQIENLAFYTVGESDEELFIDFIRYVRNSKNNTIVNQVLHNLIIESQKKNKTYLYITEKYLDQYLIDLLNKYGFVKLERGYVKFISRNIISYDEIISHLELNIRNVEVLEKYKKILLPFINNTDLDEKSKVINMERFLWPLKINGAMIPCFIVPIQPHWAMNLFNTHLANQDLFGGEQTLLLNKENVYYRSAKPKVLCEKSRVLWYISQGKRKFDGIMEIAATSYITEINIDYPKFLYGKNKQLGIYKWKDVFQTAQNDIGNKIMAFKFDLTDSFYNSLNIAKLNVIFNKNSKKVFYPPQAPISIEEKLFFDIYKAGFGE